MFWGVVPDLSCTVLVPCWDVEGGEDVFGFGGQGTGSRWCPLRLMATSWRGLRARMTRLMLISVVSWMQRALCGVSSGCG